MKSRDVSGALLSPGPDDGRGGGPRNLEMTLAMQMWLTQRQRGARWGQMGFRMIDNAHFTDYREES